MHLPELGQFVKEARLSQGVTQQQMARDLAISRSTLNAFEQGRSGDIGLRKVSAMLDYLGFTLTPVAKSPLPTFEELLAARADE